MSNAEDEPRKAETRARCRAMLSTEHKKLKQSTREQCKPPGLNGKDDRLRPPLALGSRRSASILLGLAQFRGVANIVIVLSVRGRVLA